MRHVAIRQVSEGVFCILASLAGQPRHGYALMRARAAEHRHTVWRALRGLLQDGWIERFAPADTSREKQAYRLTADGREQLRLELARMKQLTRVAGARRCKGGWDEKPLPHGAAIVSVRLPGGLRARAAGGV